MQRIQKSHGIFHRWSCYPKRGQTSNSILSHNPNITTAKFCYILTFCVETAGTISVAQLTITEALAIYVPYLLYKNNATKINLVYVMFTFLLHKYSVIGKLIQGVVV